MASIESTERTDRPSPPPGPQRGSDGRSRLRSVATILGATVAIQAINVFTGAATARLLGPTGRGILAAVTVWPSAIANAGDLGGPVAYQYESAASPHMRTTLLGNLRRIIPVQSAVLIAIAIPTMAVVLRDLPGAFQIALVFVVTFIPLNLTGRYMMAIHQGAENFVAFNRARLTLAFSYAAGVGVIFALGVKSVELVVAAVILSNVFAVIAVSIGLNFRRAAEERYDAGLTRRVFSFGLRAHVGNLTPIDSMQIDVALVVVLLGAKAAGLYVVGVSAASVIRGQGTGVGLVALTSVASSERDRQGRVIGAFFRGAMVLMIATAALIAVAAGVLVPLLYGHEFDASVSVVRILCVGMVAAALRQVLGDCLRGAGRPLVGSLAEVVSWIFAVGGLFLLVPELGADGAALAVSISYFAALAVLIYAARGSGVTVAELLIPRRTDIRYVSTAVSSRLPWGGRNR